MGRRERRARNHRRTLKRRVGGRGRKGYMIVLVVIYYMPIVGSVGMNSLFISYPCWPRCPPPAHSHRTTTSTTTSSGPSTPSIKALSQLISRLTTNRNPFRWVNLQLNPNRLWFRLLRSFLGRSLVTPKATLLRLGLTKPRFDLRLKLKTTLIGNGMFHFPFRVLSWVFMSRKGNKEVRLNN